MGVRKFVLKEWMKEGDKTQDFPFFQYLLGLGIMEKKFFILCDAIRKH